MRELAPTSSAIRPMRPRSFSTHAPVRATPSIISSASLRLEGIHLVVLQPVELPGMELTRGLGGTHDDFHDCRGQPMHGNHVRPEVIVQLAYQAFPYLCGPFACLSAGPGKIFAQQGKHGLVALLGGGHRLHDVPGVVRMVVAVEGDHASVLLIGSEEPHFALRGRHRHAAAILLLDDMVFEELFPFVQSERAGMLPFVHGVRHCARRNHDGSRRHREAFTA